MPFPAILLHTLVQSVLHLTPGTDTFYQHYIACEQALPLAGPREVTMKGDAKAQGKYRKGVKVKVCFSSIAVHLPCHQFAQQICSAILHLSPPRTVQTLHSRYHTPAHAEKYVSDMAYTGELLIGNEQQHYKYNQKGYQGYYKRFALTASAGVSPGSTGQLPSPSIPSFASFSGSGESTALVETSKNELRAMETKTDTSAVVSNSPNAKTFVVT